MAEDRKPAQAIELPHGAYTRIARRLRPKVTAQHVREVALGRRKSGRVERAIANYAASISRPTQRPEGDGTAAA